jgi:predicted nucleic acid-binding protein
MQYYDTNVLIYFMYQFHDDTKHKTSKKLISKATATNEFQISPLVIQEFIYSSS